MPGPQFVNIVTFSRKPNPAGQCIDQVVGELLREPEFSAHVESPAEPRVLIGDPKTFRDQHDAHVAARSTIVITSKGKQATRSIRKDRHTMASIVMSYPVPRVSIDTDEKRLDLARWERRNIEWLRETYGDQLRVVVAHDDEEHPHLHAWLLPDDPGADATTLHPGKVAKKQAEAVAKAEGCEPREAVKLGNNALRAEMSAWQDRYYEEVGAPLGLTRTGPKRRRLSRKAWRAEKDAATARAALIEKIGQRERETAAEMVRVDEVANEQIQEGFDLLAERREIQEMRDELEGRERDVAAREEAVAVEREDVRQLQGHLEKIAGILNGWIGEVAERLGIAPKLNEITKLIRSAGTDIENVDGRPSI